MQADAGFIQDVKNADQAGADLSSQANALRFPAGQAGGGAVQGQIMQADIEQECDAATNFLKQLRRDEPLNWIETFFDELPFASVPSHLANSPSGMAPSSSQCLTAHAARRGPED